MIAAAQKFVCVRLATYESASEAKVMTNLFVGRSGQLENTTFGILSPDGKKELIPAGRGPKQMLGRRAGPRATTKLVSTLQEIGERYAKKAKSQTALKQLPVVANVRLALNVAACDGLPLVIAFAKDAKSLSKITAALTPLAWKLEFAGRCNYVVTTELKDLAKVAGRKLTSGVLVVQPDAFGETAKVLEEIAAGVAPKQLAKRLDSGLSAAKMPAKEHREHVRSGRRAGKTWESEIPVTDPGAVRAGGRGGR